MTLEEYEDIGRAAVERYRANSAGDAAGLAVLALVSRVRELETALAAEAESHEMTRAEYQEALEESALGPVMPETPSDPVRRAIGPWCDGYACEDNLWTTLRNALIEGRLAAVAENHKR